MENYKIKVTTESESKEVCNLVEQLGLSKKQFTGFGFSCVIAVYGNEYSDFTLRNREIRNSKELTIPQLRDLVVFHCDDVSDATHIKNDGEMFGYLSSDNIEYTWSFATESWYLDSIRFSVLGLKPINRELISGADALRALADGKEVEYFNNDWIGCDSRDLVVAWYLDDVYQFRLKPQTIILNIEIPAPFEPKVGEKYFYLAHMNIGYDHDIYESTNTDECQTQFGAWRTEEEIKQVVAALRQGFKL